MKILLPILTLCLASLTVSCQSISTTAGAITHQASIISPTAKSCDAKLKKGMCKEEVRAMMGIPSYQYAVAEKEIWVYETSNFLVEKAKKTALNMVPVLGPTATLLKDFRAITKNVKAAVEFDCEGKVIDFLQNE